MSDRWYNAHRRDHFFKEAKKHGYRARSAYKLKQLQKKYRIINPGDCIVDLGAAPGGWSQVLVELTGPEGAVFGVDLQRIAPVEGATFLQGDLTKKATHDRLQELLAEEEREEVDVLVSDMAPDMSGNYDLDQARSVHLCEMALRFADSRLREGGNFACKIFEGADFQEFRATLRTRFGRIFQFRPPASRSGSSEIYLVGLRFDGGAGADSE